MQSSSELIDAFCDQVWLQDGLAPSSLASYRRDLEQWAGWLERPGRLAARRAAHRCRGLSRRAVPGQGQGDVDRPALVVAAPLLRAAAAAGHAARRPDAARAGAEAAATAPQEPERGQGRGAPGGPRHRDHARPARSRDAGNAVRDGPPRFRAGRPHARPGVPRHGCRPSARQGQQGTARSARRRIDRLARAIPRRRTGGPHRAAARATPCS